jgi:hypothetical protein
MDTKLTLRLDKEVIDKAKGYARDRGTSLSHLVETYFAGLTQSNATSGEKSSGLVAELAGLLADKEVDISKEGYTRYLARKHS